MIFPKKNRRHGLAGPGAAISLVSLVSLASALPAQDWTRFRGPNGTGRSDADSIPVQWTEKDYNWRVKVPGAGHSQPVLWGEKIFLTSAEENGAQRLILCLRAGDGSAEWTRRFDSRTHRKHQRNSYASSTPAVDAERVYAAFSTPESCLLLALDHAGKEAWRRDLGPFESQHGHGTSPILHDGMVILGNEQDGESFVVSLDAKTGDVRWKAPRRTEEAAYGTPCVYDEGGRPALLFSSHAHGLSSLDAATGSLNWEARVFDKRTVSSPVFAAGLAIGTCGSGGGGNFLVAVRPGGKGDVTETHVAFRLTRSIPYVPTPVARGDLLFLWGDLGVVSCVELPAGKVLWQERVQGNFSASPVSAGDRIYALSDEGDVVAIAAGREFKLLGRNPLGEGSRTAPAISGGRMYLRTATQLFSIGGAKPKVIPDRP